MQLVLIRHGQSEWNKKNLFTGWTDVPLSEQGKQESLQTAKYLQKHQCRFDYAFSSVLQRACSTMDIILKHLNLQHITQIKAWQLNERHYGSLQGENRQNMIEKHGEKQVHSWRRDFKTQPPQIQHQNIDTSLYKDLKDLPKGESLKNTQDRVLGYWEDCILPHIHKQKSVLIVAHGNSLRALIKHLEHISDDKISLVEIQTAQARMYKFHHSNQTFTKIIP